MKLSLPFPSAAKTGLRMIQGGLEIVRNLLVMTMSLGEIVARPLLVLGALSLFFCLFPYWQVVVNFESVRPADVAPLVEERTRWFLKEASPWVLQAAVMWILMRIFGGPLRSWADSQHREQDWEAYDRWQRIQLQQSQLDKQREASDAK